MAKIKLKLKLWDFYNREMFDQDAARYILATTEGRLLFHVDRVSRSRKSKVTFIYEINYSVPDGKREFYLDDFGDMIYALGFKYVGDTDGIRTPVNYDIHQNILQMLVELELLSQQDYAQISQITQNEVHKNKFNWMKMKQERR